MSRAWNDLISWELSRGVLCREIELDCSAISADEVEAAAERLGGSSDAIVMRGNGCSAKKFVEIFRYKVQSKLSFLAILHDDHTWARGQL